MQRQLNLKTIIMILPILVCCLRVLAKTWYKRPIHSTESTSKNIIRQGLGISEYSESFETMVPTNNILEITVEKTNEKAILEYEKWNEKHPENKKVWTSTDSVGIKAYIGLD
ncbi:hypothetical protein JTB14_005104 [Gonioctena quinquepunctata]|nr:hypothetical protein JTB14_005104 [Gonioctena quinquepunctata]